MGRKKVTIEELNKELTKHFENVVMIEFEGMSKPCKIQIADELRSYAKASKIVSDLRKLLNGGEFTNYDLLDYEIPSTYKEIIIKSTSEEEEFKIYTVPTLEEIIKAVGKNEFNLHEVYEHYKDTNTLLGLSAIMDDYRISNNVYMTYEVINKRYTPKYKIIAL